MEELEIEDRIVSKLIAYFDRRFKVLESEVSQHSAVLNAISQNIHKILDVQSKGTPLKVVCKEAPIESILRKSTNNDVPKYSAVLTQRSNEVESTIRLKSSETNKQNKENFISQIEPSSTKSRASQSPRFGKTVHKKEASEKKEQIKKRHLCLDAEVFDVSKECSINSVFSPHNCTGEKKELIIEPIEILFQESPTDRKWTAGSSSKCEYKSPISELVRDPQKSFGLLSSRRAEKSSLDTLPGNCLLLIGQYVGGVLPPFAVACKSVLGKYVGYTKKKINESINILKVQQVFFHSIL
eukprot:TRINITY_DN9529_c0_g1_i1.p1 TRINITY_DN9529_c0_g1~~TRINITY_DN9529_c0_g1_i1.p1  ORF type:complete len:297 (-),score=56.90 TRINITY_DN9529_c0_g1_i1:10-900(-)